MQIERQIHFFADLIYELYIVILRFSFDFDTGLLNRVLRCYTLHIMSLNFNPKNSERKNELRTKTQIHESGLIKRHIRRIIQICVSK